MISKIGAPGVIKTKPSHNSANIVDNMPMRRNDKKLSRKLAFKVASNSISLTK